MNFVIYIKDERNSYLGSYLLKDEYNFNKKLSIDFSEDLDIYYNSEANNNLKVLNAIYNDLALINKDVKRNNPAQNVCLRQYKCLGKVKDTIYFLVRLSLYNNELKLASFIKLEKWDIFSKASNKLMNKYTSKIKHDKNKAVMSAIFSELHVKDYVILALELLLFIASFSIMFIDKSANVGDSLKNLSILIMSIFVILIQSVVTIINKIHKGYQFKHNIDLATSFEGTNKDELNEKILTNLSTTYKDYSSKKYLTKDNKVKDIFLYNDYENINLDNVCSQLPIEVSKNKIPLSN